MAANSVLTGQPTIAVVIPNRNDASSVARCLRSVIRQATPPDEVIVVDDHSSDNSVSIIRREIADCEFARLIENPLNLGTMAASNIGLERVQSEYVLFLAANDFVLPGIFARAKKSFAASSGAGLWSAMVWLVDTAGRPIRMHPSPVVSLRDTYLSPNACMLLARRLGNWFTGPTLIYRRETLVSVGGFDPAYKGLSDLFTALAIASRWGAVYSPEPLAVIQVHPGGHLFETLADTEVLNQVLRRLYERAPKLAPLLFTYQFLERTAARICFACIRASSGGNIDSCAGSTVGWTRAALELVNRAVPTSARSVRTALAFMVLRPFDLLPMLWHRFLGAAAVKLRLRIRGTRPLFP